MLKPESALFLRITAWLILTLQKIAQCLANVYKAPFAMDAQQVLHTSLAGLEEERRLAYMRMVVLTIFLILVVAVFIPSLFLRADWSIRLLNYAFGGICAVTLWMSYRIKVSWIGTIYLLASEGWVLFYTQVDPGGLTIRSAGTLCAGSVLVLAAGLMLPRKLIFPVVGCITGLTLLDALTLPLIYPAPSLISDSRALVLMILAMVYGLSFVISFTYSRSTEALAAMLFAALQRQQQLDAVKDEFINIASHEIRTPLTLFKGNVQLAQRRLNKLTSGDEAVPVEQLSGIRSLLVEANEQTNRLTRLVEDLMDVTRIQVDGLEVHPDRFDLAALVDATVTEMRQLDPTRPFLWNAPESTSWIFGDADLMRQVLHNYLGNARKYSPLEKPITISLTRMESRVVVCISDLGQGIAPAEQEHIWERYHRVPGVHSQQGSQIGLGIGLYLAKMIVTRHHGQVGVRSSPGNGATFWFSMPLLTLSELQQPQHIPNDVSA